MPIRQTRPLAAALLVAFLLTPESWARPIKKEEIEPFAKNFKCTNPMLQWQFDKLITLADENDKMASRAGSRRQIIRSAKDLGESSEPWLYRGVTNRQFNEQQILRLIFNDSTSVSESRWLTQDLFGNGAASQGDLVQMRTTYQQRPYREQCDRFKEAYGSVAGKIEDLLNTSDASLNRFSEHVKIGTSYNGTPQAIQFLTPHKSYAESYGEFVLHVKEVVPRGIDVERYNAHNPNWSYTVGSIYRLDQDEYMVPSHIPAWDVQAVKVRAGSGWHRGNYGPPLYYYSKITEDGNPCNVLAIRVDGPSDNDDTRRPVGVLLRCPEGQTCASRWDGALAEEARLRAVVEAAKVDGAKLYYLPYREYQTNNPEVFRQSSLATILGVFDKLKGEIKGNAELWKHVIHNGYATDYHSAIELTKKHALLREPAFKAEWAEKFKEHIAGPRFSIDRGNAKGVIELASFLGLQENPRLKAVVLGTMDSPAERLAVHRQLEAFAEKDAKLRPLAKQVREKFATLKNLNPREELALLQSRAGGAPATAAARRPVVATLAKGFNAEPGSAAEYWDLLTGTPAERLALVNEALTLVLEKPADFPNADPLALWRHLAPKASRLEGAENIMGLCLSSAMAQGTKSSAELTAFVADVGLPMEREVDTIRSLWTYALNEDRAKNAAANPYKYFSSDMRKDLYDKLAQAASAADAADGGSRVKKLKNSFAQFYLELLTPPDRSLGFSALNHLRFLADDSKKPLVLQKGETATYTVAGQTHTVPASAVNAVLLESLSSYHLHTLRQQYQREENAAVKKEFADTARKTLAGFRKYASEQLVTDLARPERVQMLKDRLTWNRYEDTVGLIIALAETEKDRQVKRKLTEAAAALKAKIPEMTGRSEAAEKAFWTELEKEENK